MKIVFKDSKLEHYYKVGDDNGIYPKWIFNNFVKAVSIMQAVDTVAQLRNFRGLRVQQKKGDMKGIWSARLNDSWRLEFTVDKDWIVHVINILRISNHYQ